MKRKNIKAGNRLWKVEKNFSKKTSTGIRDKPKFNKGISHQGDSCLSKVCYDRDSNPRVKRKCEVDTPLERPPFRKCGKLNEGEYIRASNDFYTCSELGHIIMDCPYIRD